MTTLVYVGGVAVVIGMFLDGQQIAEKQAKWGICSYCGLADEPGLTYTPPGTKVELPAPYPGGKSEYVCFICDERTHGRTAMLRHLREEHEAGACPNCTDRLFTREELVAHSRRLHSEPPPSETCGHTLADVYTYLSHDCGPDGKVLVPSVASDSISETWEATCRQCRKKKETS